MRWATSKDQALVERICKDPSVFPWIVHDHSPPLDVKPFLQAPHRVLLVDGGVFLAQCTSPGHYAVHTCLLPSTRGAKALREARTALDLIFSSTDCQALTTIVPEHNRQAVWFARAMGFQFQFTRRAIWPVDGKGRDVDFFQLTIDSWALRGSYLEQGRLFHTKLHAHLPELVSHPDDGVHDAYVGATMAMICAGQADKAIAFYNSWARFALYAPIHIVSFGPLVIDIQSCLINVQDGDFTVKGKRCQQAQQQS